MNKKVIPIKDEILIFNNEQDVKYFIDLIRLDKPIGTALLFWPCLFSSINSSETIPYFLIIKFLIGAFLMRSAGCIINDIVDKKFDALVERTKSRPLASNNLSNKEAYIFLIILLSLSFALLLTFKIKTILFTSLSLPLVFLYPFMKRITFFPQLFLGITFNYGSLVASMEINNYISASSVAIYIACIFWTLAYDTIYGFMDIKDDKKIGVKSLSIYLENKSPKIFLSIFYAIFLILIFPNWKFNSAISLAIAAIGIYWQLYKLNLNNPIDCLNKFKINNILGLIIAFGYF